ncbi:MAG TPA: hypothetical protein VFF12_17040 [Myxococcaceae bacterium]|nr:hypothetical protein [Myxococcaceae bacterium]
MNILRLSLLVCAWGGMGGCSETPAIECLGVQCGPLPPAITFRVLDGADGGNVPGARINGFPCGSVCPGQLPDGGVVEEAGTFDFSAEAPGYQDRQLEVTVPPAASIPGQCCGIPFVPQQRDVPLMPL